MSIGSVRRAFGRMKNPIRVVTCCFFVVLVLSMVLSWRVAVVLEQAYVGQQHSDLQRIASTLNRQLQHSVDNLLFYRNTMYYALQSPISTDRSRSALQAYDSQRQDATWNIRLDLERSIPIHGVSDQFVAQHPQLERSNSLAHTDLDAALELSYILQMADYTRDFQRRTFYVSRGGWYISTTAISGSNRNAQIFDRILNAPWLSGNNDHNNRSRGVIWTPAMAPENGGAQGITVSVPLDYEHRWYGVLGMDFSLDSMHAFLMEASNGQNEGTVLLYDQHLKQIASSSFFPPSSPWFDAEERHRLDIALASPAREGHLRMGTRFISWVKLSSFDGVLVKIHTLQEGMAGKFGSISIVLVLLGTLCGMMLVASWYVVCRLVANMLRLQGALTWRANYDALTHLYSRGAFYDLVRRNTALSRKTGESYSVIQIDLDHFKLINDTYGHSVGDKVLAHAANMIISALRSSDIAGRIGGEEFCVFLPNTTLSEARQVAERIRQRIENKEVLAYADTTVRITASFGVSCSLEIPEDNFSQLQIMADERLYKAKAAGRNQVCIQ